MSESNGGRLIIRNLVIIFATWMIWQPVMFATSTYFQAFLKELGATPVIIGTMFAASTIAGIPFRLLGGYVADSRGRKRVVYIGPAILSMSYLLVVAAKDWKLVFAYYVISSVSYMIGPAMSALISESLPKDARSRGFTLLNVSTGVSAVLGPVIALYMLSITGDVVRLEKMLFVVLFVEALAVAVLRKIFLVETKRSAPREISLTGFVRAYKEVGAYAVREIPLVVILYFTIYVIFGLTSLLQYYALYYVGVDLVFWGELMMYGSIALGLGAFPGMILGDKIGRKVPIMAGSVIGTVALYMIYKARFLTKGGFLVAVLLSSIAMGLIFSVMSAYIADLFPTDIRARGYTVMYVVGDLASATGQFLAGSLYEGLNPTSPFLLATILASVSVAVSIFVPETLSRGDAGTDGSEVPSGNGAQAP